MYVCIYIYICMYSPGSLDMWPRKRLTKAPMLSMILRAAIAICTNTTIYIYIYIYRERERCTYTYVHVYIYIYIYI